MSKRLKRHVMVGNAIQRVLARTLDRAVIGSLADLKRAYEQELAAHRAEIEAEADAVVARFREVGTRTIGVAIREYRACEECGGSIEGAQRRSRWFCSDRCRQRAYRKRQRATA